MSRGQGRTGQRAGDCCHRLSTGYGVKGRCLLPWEWVGAEAERGPRQRWWLCSREALAPVPWQRRAARVGVLGGDRLSDGCFDPSMLTPHSCLYWVLLPSPLPPGPPMGLGRGPVPGDMAGTRPVP